MKILAGILLVLLGLSMLAPAFKSLDDPFVLMEQNRFNKDIDDAENYLKKNPIQDEVTSRDYVQEISNYKHLADTFNTTWVENKPMISIIVRIMFGVVGLLYIIGGFVLMMRLNWVTPMMVVIATGFFILINILSIEANSYINLSYEMSKEVYKLSFILGFLKDSYSQAAADIEDKDWGRFTVFYISMSIIYLTIPIIYLLKVFLKEKKQ